MDFVAVDVETANANLYSICQIGVIVFRAGEIASRYSILIDPECYFEGVNIAIHGITPDDVVGSPTFERVFPFLEKALARNVVVHHTHFDRVALIRAAARYGLSVPTCSWLDSARVVRRTWERYSRRGYGLNAVSGDLGIVFKHHDVAEDAEAAGRVLIAALIESRLSIQDWLTKVNSPIDPSTAGPIVREGDPHGLLFGETIAFTGALEIPRREAADLASRAGCDVSPGVTKHTTLVVVGDQDLARLAGKSKSSKHIKAEAMIAEGYPIRILSETDFKSILALARVT